jgi:AcrR family transcriptional regulator
MVNDVRRTQLLDIGLELFSTQAFDTVSIDEIARRVGISRGLLYHYFTSKRVFYVEIVRLAAQDLLSRLGQGAASTPGERLRTDLAAYLGFVAERSAGFVTLLRGGIGSDPEVQLVVDSTRDAIVDAVLQGTDRVRRSAATEVALFGWVGFVESASLRWLVVDIDERPPAETMIRLFSQQLAAALNSIEEISTA